MSNIAAVYILLLAAASHGPHKVPFTRNTTVAVAQAAKPVRVALVETKRAGRAG